MNLPSGISSVATRRQEIFGIVPSGVEVARKPEIGSATGIGTWLHFPFWRMQVILQHFFLAFRRQKRGFRVPNAFDRLHMVEQTVLSGGTSNPS
ncbi:MAG TPA: hypothetical protein VNQ76_15760 [Planctomicrobium sp.]|nr:hypothetical protein [Planctomicrobium sp.]